MSHASSRLDDVVHQRVRLGALAVLQEAPRIEFGILRNTLDVTDGNLSRHLTVLEAAGLVGIEKAYEGRRPKTWVVLTPAGRKAFTKEVAALRALVGDHLGKP